jgi:hypothetical protein
VRDGDDQDSPFLDAVHDAEWEPLQEVSPRSVVERRPRFGQSDDPGFGGVDFRAECCRGSYAAVRVPARGRLCFLESFFEDSSSRVTAGCRVDATTRLRPWNCPGLPSVDAIEPRTNLRGPGSLGVGVYFAFETLNQLAGKRGSFFVRKPEGLDQEFLGIHRLHCIATRLGIPQAGHRRRVSSGLQS